MIDLPHFDVWTKSRQSGGNSALVSRIAASAALAGPSRDSPEFFTSVIHEITLVFTRFHLISVCLRQVVRAVSGSKLQAEQIRVYRFSSWDRWYEKSALRNDRRDSGLAPGCRSRSRELTVQAKVQISAFM